MKVFLRWAVDMAVRFSSSLDWVLCLALGALMLIGLAVLKSAGGDGLVFAQGARSRSVWPQCGRSRGCRSCASARPRR